MRIYYPWCYFLFSLISFREIFRKHTKSILLEPNWSRLQAWANSTATSYYFLCILLVDNSAVKRKEKRGNFPEQTKPSHRQDGEHIFIAFSGFFVSLSGSKKCSFATLLRAACKAGQIHSDPTCFAFRPQESKHPGQVFCGLSVVFHMCHNGQKTFDQINRETMN